MGVLVVHMLTSIAQTATQVRISCAGYPSRRLVGEFVDRFGLLNTRAVGDAALKEAQVAQAIIDTAGLQGTQIGLTKVRHHRERERVCVERSLRQLASSSI
jgi:hypothetical protein